MATRVLLADDCATIRHLARTLLEREGCEIVGEAADGAEAVRLAVELGPQVAVLDLAMPVLTGLQAAREIRRVKPEIAMVLLTIHTAEENILGAMGAGMLACVAKSDAADDLPRAVREVLRGSTFLSMKPSRVVLDAFGFDVPQR